MNAKAVEFLTRLAQMVSAGEIRLIDYEMSCPAVPIPSPDGLWQEFEPSPVTTLTIRYETRRR